MKKKYVFLLELRKGKTVNSTPNETVVQIGLFSDMEKLEKWLNKESIQYEKDIRKSDKISKKYKLFYSILEWPLNLPDFGPFHLEFRSNKPKMIGAHKK